MSRGQTRYLFCVEFHDLCASVLSFAPRFDRNYPGARKAALEDTMHESVCPLTKIFFFHVALTTVHSPHFVWCVQVFALVSDRSGVGMVVQS